MIQQESDDLCWKAIPIKYDSYSQEENDKYGGDVFDCLYGFDSPHFLWRRFHKNMCKAIIVSKLKSYSLSDSEDNFYFYEISEHENVSFSVEILSRHQSLSLIVSAFETYLKDSFIEVLKLLPNKQGNQQIEKLTKKFNFQNIQSINRAFSWLFEKDIKIVDEQIDLALSKRHKIIHESLYDPEFSEKELDQYYVDFLMQAENLHDYLEHQGFYARIKHAHE